MSDFVTFADLHALLENHGFTCRPGNQETIVFENPAKIMVVFRPHRNDERVDRANLAVVRHTLVENGIVTEKDFARFVNEKFASA